MSSSRAAKSKAIETGSHPASKINGSSFTERCVCGEVVSLDANGIVFVDYAQNSLGPLQAKTLVQELFAGVKVLLALDGGDPTRPIILGVIHDTAKTRKILHLKASQVLIEAEEILTLKCGQGSFEAQKDGKIQIKGRDVVSRATRTNKMRGSTVLIN